MTFALRGICTEDNVAIGGAVDAMRGALADLRRLDQLRPVFDRHLRRCLTGADRPIGGYLWRI
ncbi:MULTISPECIES: hypothetical protein [unclassified Phaeobacter]|uniref:hypothetical protein n=1 Tax=unclassified Phaeobacter TaxID=2621772 RepID=UPI003A8AF16D